MNAKRRDAKAFTWGALIGILGGLIGRGGAEFRLPVLVRVFRFPTPEAIILNKAVSPAVAMPRKWVNVMVLVMLSTISLVMLAEAALGTRHGETALPSPGVGHVVAGVGAGLVMGILAALLGVARGDLPIPTIVLLYGQDIRVAGTLSLAVSFPTMIAGFARYTQAQSFGVLRDERPLLAWMVAGSVLGAWIGGLLPGIVPARVLMGLLGAILLISAIKTFHHVNERPSAGAVQ